MSRAQAQQVQQSLDEVQSLRQRLGTPDWRDEDWGLTAARTFPRGREPLASEPV